jgi:lysophospholipase L1-like esterase
VIRSERAARLGLAIGAPLLFVAVAELVLRALDLPHADRDPTFSEMVRRVDAQEFFYEVDPDLFWTLRPNLEAEGEATSFRTNSMGLRGREVGSPESRTLRVLLLGDSVTFGYGLEEHATLAAQLRELLLDSGLPIDVVNGGIPGYSSHQGLRQAERLVPATRPDVVVVCFGFNDARDLFASDAEIARAGAGWREARRALFRTRFYRLLRTWIVRPQRATGTAVARVSPEAYEANVRAICRLSKDAGAVPVLLETPFQRETRQPYGPVWFTLHEPIGRYRERARSVSRQEGIRYVEAGPLTERSSQANEGWFLDPAHPNAAGTRVLAESLRVALIGALEARRSGGTRSNVSTSKRGG